MPGETGSGRSCIKVSLCMKIVDTENVEEADYAGETMHVNACQ
jgi:hypothetical protein